MGLLAIVFLMTMMVSVVVAVVASKGKTVSRKKVNERLVALGDALNDEAVQQLALSSKAKEGLADRIGAKIKSFHFAEKLELLILYSGSKATVGSIVLASGATMGGAGILAYWFSGMLFLVLVAAAIGAFIPYFFLKFKKGRRLKKFNEALPDAIELIARALRAGHSMGSAIEVVSEQSPEPLATEFAVCFQQQKFGIPFRDALLSMGTRIPSEDLHFLITAVLVQKETGGDLTDILDRTTRVIRDRIRIEGEVKTYTAQGRLTGCILASMPVVMLVLINFITPGYSHVLFYDPLGQKLLGAGATFIIIGGLIIRKIVDIKV